jgi:hypothetical protein
MHLNRDCRYPDLSNLFGREDLTPEVEELLADIPRDIRAQQAKTLIVEPGLAATLAQLEGPFAYLDFETINPAIPA